MRIRHWMVSFVLIFAWTAISPDATDAADDKRPNIVIVLADDKD